LGGDVEVDAPSIKRTPKQVATLLYYITGGIREEAAAQAIALLAT